MLMSWWSPARSTNNKQKTEYINKLKLKVVQPDISVKKNKNKEQKERNLSLDDFFFLIS